MTNSARKLESVYLPSNEPYLGRESLFQFDKIILLYLEKDADIAKFTHTASLTDLQKAACQIIPQGVNLALTIRELIQQGYLFGALVLMRSLIERAATISYLFRKPAKLTLLQSGWNYNGKDRRPSLKELVEVMGPNFPGDATIAQRVVDLFNHITHGDPIGATWNLIHLSDGALGYSVSKVVDDPDLCDFICFQSLCYLIVLKSMRDAIFVQVNSMD